MILYSRYREIEYQNKTIKFDYKKYLIFMSAIHPISKKLEKLKTS